MKHLRFWRTLHPRWGVLTLLLTGLGIAIVALLHSVYLPMMQQTTPTIVNNVYTPSPIVTVIREPTQTHTPIPPTVTKPTATARPPTETPHPNPYVPSALARIDAKNAWGIEANSQQNTAYGIVNFNSLLKIESSPLSVIFDKVILPERVERIIIDEVRERVYALSKIKHDQISIIENDTVVGEVIFPGHLNDMILEQKRGWIYAWGSEDEDINNDGELQPILMISDGSEIIDVINPLPFMPQPAVTDPDTGYVYLGGTHRVEMPDNTPRYRGGVLVYDGTTMVADLDYFDSTIPNMTIDHNGYLHAHGSSSFYVDYNFYTLDPALQLVSQQNTATRNEDGEITDIQIVADMMVHPLTNELYLLDSTSPQILIMSLNDSLPTLTENVLLPEGRGVGQMIADPITGNVYVNEALDRNAVYVIHNKELIATLPFTPHPSYLSIDEQTGQLYVASTLSGHFWVLGWEDGAPTPMPFSD